MPELFTIILFAGAALAMQVTPSPDMMLVMGRGVGQGYRIAQATALGIASAGLIQLPLLAFGVSSIVISQPWLFDLIRLLGAVYLLYIGLKLLRSIGRPTQAPSSARTTFRRAMLDGAATNLLNPKIVVFQFAFIPQFVNVEVGPVWSQMLFLGFVMKACGLLVMSTIALTSGVTGGWMARHPLWLKIQGSIAGVVMVGLGIRLFIDVGLESHTARN